MGCAHVTRLHFSLENDRAAFRRELEARVTGAVSCTVACSCQCSKACSSQRWQGKVEKIDQLERDIQTARDFSGNWSMHQETHGPYVKSLCIMQRTKILILHWSWFCVRPFIILVNCRSLARFDF